MPPISEPASLRRPHQQAERGHRQRLLGRSDQCQRTVMGKEIQIGVQIMLCRDGVEDEIAAARITLHLLGITGAHNFVSSQPQRVLSFALGSREDNRVRPEGRENLTPMCPSPPSPTIPTFIPLVTPLRRIGE